jgi:hypothetical protein
MSGLRPLEALPIELGNFAHDGAIYYCISSCRGEYYTGGPAVKLTDPAQATQLVQVLRDDVQKIKSFAARLQEAQIRQASLAARK